MGVVRALPAVAGQVTPSQAIAMLDEEIIPETEMLSDDDAISDTFYATDVEATQPPVLTPIQPLDLIHILMPWATAYGIVCLLLK